LEGNQVELLLAMPIQIPDQWTGTVPNVLVFVKKIVVIGQ
jgi:hypothetical protein